MTNLYTYLRFIVFSCLCLCTFAYAQTDTASKMPPLPIRQNAGFDVIIKKNGSILFGLVTEVGLDLIYYKRTDIPDGPVYTVPRKDVYAISYRNQVVDYLRPAEEEGMMQQPGAPNMASGAAGGRTNTPYPHPYYRNNVLLQNGAVHLGIGFIRAFTKVKHANSYNSNGGMPVLSLGYDVSLSTKAVDRSNPYSYTANNNLKLAVLIGFGSHKFSNEDYSLYDSTYNNLNLTEKIFGLYVYGKYLLTNSNSRFQPYITLGAGIATSHITSENHISFLNDDSKLLVKSGARGVSLNIMARGGVDYYINNQVQAFIDAGSGLSLINLGVSFKVK